MGWGVSGLSECQKKADDDTGGDYDEDDDDDDDDDGDSVKDGMGGVWSV